ncbi:Uncharacterised protein [Mycobacteroides abscessus]|nr:Uncharacterised protein [Mycobacteroides abscessus]
MRVVACHRLVVAVPRRVGVEALVRDEGHDARAREVGRDVHERLGRQAGPRTVHEHHAREVVARVDGLAQHAPDGRAVEPDGHVGLAHVVGADRGGPAGRLPADGRVGRLGDEVLGHGHRVPLRPGDRTDDREDDREGCRRRGGPEDHRGIVRRGPPAGPWCPPDGGTGDVPPGQNPSRWSCLGSRCQSLATFTCRSR